MYRLAARFVPLVAAALLSTVTVAAEPVTPASKTPPSPKEAPPPPPIPKNYNPPETDPTAEELQPEVRITTKGDEIHQEYRINGRLYMVKVTPALGPPYYLIDQEGTGTFVRSGIEPEVNPPMWVIKEW